jgi:hypothetical protein
MLSVLSTTQQASDVATLFKEISERRLSFDLSNKQSRTELLEGARSLCFALETPMEALLRMEWAEVRSH